MASAGIARGDASGAVSGGARDGSFGREAPRELRPGGVFDRRLAEMAARDAFSGTVLLAHRGRTVLSRSYGFADRERSVHNGPDTIFGLGSITKLFTAIAVSQLVERGDVRYPEPLGAYLDGFPAEVAESVTVHHLLTHTSGMGDHHSAEFWEVSRSWDSAAEVMDGTMEIIRRAPLAFAPGADHTYSNSAYFTLGAIVEAVSGQPYHAYVREHVFGPAGMVDTDFYTRPEWRSNERIAHPYALQPSGGRRDTVDNRVFIGGPPGGAFSTGPDLDAFARALWGGRLLSPALTALVTSGKYPMPGPKGSPAPGAAGAPGAGGAAGPDGPRALQPFQAYGPIATIVNGQRAIGHGGGAVGPEVGGISTSFDTYQDLGWTVVILGNYDRLEYGPLLEVAREAITGRTS